MLLAVSQFVQAGTGTVAPVAIDLSVALDPQSRKLNGSATLTINDTDETEIVLAAGLAATLDGSDRRAPRRVAQGLQRWQIPAGPRGRQVTLRWSGTLALLDTSQQHRDTLGPAVAVASPEGSFLPAAALWYPHPFKAGNPQLHSWSLTLTLPRGQKGLVPGNLTDERHDDNGYTAHFEFPWPGEGIDLMAGPYRIDERLIRSIDGRPLRLRTVFAPSLGPLADGYLDSVAGYIARYESAIGPYPFGGFSVVSSPTPTGFGMPTLTYLGESVLRLPFIRHTSLGHEVLHNWWGNGVYPDYPTGNWSEGLTTFMADYAYAEEAGSDKAAEMRASWLRDLAAVPPGSTTSLRAFTSRHHGASQAIGYGKAAMLFVMLRDRIGAASFEHGLRTFWQDWRFRTASWRDLQHAFEQASGDDLQTFFTQWTTRSSLPSITMTSASRHGSELRLRLDQRAPAYQLDIPLRVVGPGSSNDLRVRMDRPTQVFGLEVAADAIRVELDPDARLLRRLGPGEAPPILRDVTFDPKAGLLILGDAPFGNVARQLAGRLLDHPTAGTPPPAATGNQALLLIGPDAMIDDWLARHALATRPRETAAADVAMWTLRRENGQPLAIISARDATALDAATRPLPHYGGQSWLAIDDGRVRRKGVWPVRPQSIAVLPEN